MSPDHILQAVILAGLAFVLVSLAGIAVLMWLDARKPRL
jgi:hypothetical protein